MTTTTITLSTILGTDIRSRSNANFLRQEIPTHHITTIDMSGITFISRSFADELLSIATATSTTITGATGEVKTMLDMVSRSRQSHTPTTITPLGHITHLNDMKSVTDFFSTI